MNRTAVAGTLALVAASVLAVSGCTPSPSPFPSPPSSVLTPMPTMSSPSASPSGDPIPASAYPCTDPAPTAPAPTAAQMDNYKAVIETANTQPMSAHACTTVVYILASTECCGDMPKDDALIDWGRRLANSTSTPWNFSPDPTLVAEWRSGPYAPFFPPSSLIGINEDGTVATVGFDGDVITFLYYADLELLAS